VQVYRDTALDHTQWDTHALRKAPVDSRSARRAHTHTHTQHTHKRQTSMHQEQFFFLWISSLALYLYCFLTRFLVLIVLPCTFAFTLKHTTHTSMAPAGFFCILLYSVRTSALLVSLSWLSCICLLVCTYNARHKYLCPRRGSNLQPQQAIGCRPLPYTGLQLESAGFEPTIPAIEGP
jgi:hypothetical protein